MTVDAASFSPVVTPRSSRVVGVCRRDVPDRRRPGPFLDGSGQVGAGLHAGADRIPGRPAAGRILQDSNIVERSGRRIEGRVAPQAAELGSTFVAREAAIVQVDGGIVLWTTVSLGIDGTTVGARDVEDLLLVALAIAPDLDDLKTLQRGTGLVPHRPHQEARLVARLADQIATHRHTALVGSFDHVRTSLDTVVVVEAGKEANPGSRSRRAEGLLASHRVEQRFARVLLCPDSGEPRRAELGKRQICGVGTAVFERLIERHRATSLGGAVGRSDLAHVVVFFRRAAGVVSVGS